VDLLTNYYLSLDLFRIQFQFPILVYIEIHFLTSICIEQAGVRFGRQFRITKCEVLTIIRSFEIMSTSIKGVENVDLLSVL